MKDKNIVILCSPTSEDFKDMLLKGKAGFFFPPQGLMLVAQTLKNAGYDVRVFDGNFDINYKNSILNIISTYTEKIIFVGFYLTFLQVKECIEIIKKIKIENENILIVTGGPFSSVFYKTIMESNLVSICCIGDGAEVTAKIANSIVNNKDFRGIPNICFKEGDKTIVNPKTCRDELHENNRIYYENFIDIEGYVNKFNLYLTRDYNPEIRRSIPILTGLGCSFKCAFCENALLGHKHISLSAKGIVEQIIHYHEKFNIDSFAFFDEDFFIDRNRLYQFIELLEKSKLKIKWGTQCRVNYFRENYVNSEFLKRLENSGCVRLSMGIESGSPRMLKKINKGITPEQAIRTAEFGRDSKIYFSYSFIINLPDETREDFNMTFDLVKKLLSIKKNSFVSAFHRYFSYPGTPLSIELEKKLGYDIADKLKFEQFSELSLESYNNLINPDINDMYRECKVYYYIIKYEKLEKILCFKLLFKIVGRIRMSLNFYYLPIEIIMKNRIKSFVKSFQKKLGG